MNLKTEYEEFLKKIKEDGHEEIDFLKFIRSRHLPPVRSESTLTEEELLNGVKRERDYTRFDFNGVLRLSKRRLIFNIINYILDNNLNDITNLNLLGRRHRMTPVTRPLIQKLEEIPSNYLSRYFIKGKDLLYIGTEKYAIYNQLHDESFKVALKVFSETYNLEINKSI